MKVNRRDELENSKIPPSNVESTKRSSNTPNGKQKDCSPKRKGSESVAFKDENKVEQSTRRSRSRDRRAKRKLQLDSSMEQTESESESSGESSDGEYTSESEKDNEINMTFQVNEDDLTDESSDQDIEAGSKVKKLNKQPRRRRATRSRSSRRESRSKEMANRKKYRKLSHRREIQDNTDQIAMIVKLVKQQLAEKSPGKENNQIDGEKNKRAYRSLSMSTLYSPAMRKNIRPRLNNKMPDVRNSSDKDIAQLLNHIDDLSLEAERKRRRRS